MFIRLQLTERYDRTLQRKIKPADLENHAFENFENSKRNDFLSYSTSWSLLPDKNEVLW